MRIKLIFTLIACSAGTVLAQNSRTDNTFDVTVSPSFGFRVLGKANPPSSYKGTTEEFRDSLNKADRPGQSLNFGIQYMTKKSAFKAFSVGLSYTDMTFRRRVDNLTIGYDVHPDVGVIAGVIQAGQLRIKYDYHYRHIEIPLLWYKSAEGYSNLRDFDLWYFGGIAPAYMFGDVLRIRTEGFTLNGTNYWAVQDKDVTGNSFNVIAHAGFRSQYHMYKGLHGLVAPHLRIPLLPSSGGAQSFWIPQLSLDLGLVFLLDRD